MYYYYKPVGSHSWTKAFPRSVLLSVPANFKAKLNSSQPRQGIPVQVTLIFCILVDFQISQLGFT